MAAQHGHDRAIEPEVACGPDDVGGLPARDDGPCDRPMDGARDEAVDTRRPVDGGVERDADDAPDGIVRCTVILSEPGRRPPPRRWAGRPCRPAPASTAIRRRRARRSASSTGTAVEPRGEEPGIERVAGAGRVDGLDRRVQRRARSSPRRPTTSAPVRTELHGDDPRRRRRAPRGGGLGVVHAGEPHAPHAAFGRTHVRLREARRRTRRPTPPSGPSWDPGSSSRPGARRPEQRRGAPPARPGWRKRLPTWRWRARAEQRVGDVGRARVGDRAQRGEDRAIRAVAEDDRGAGRPSRGDPAAGDVDAARRQRVEHEPAERVVADDARPSPPAGRAGPPRRR